jgi:hypothetical protein
LYSSPNIISFTRSKTSWDGHVARMAGMNCMRTVIVKREGKRQLKRP